MMKKILVIMSLACFLLAGNQNAFADDLEKHIKESRVAVKEYMGSLKHELVTAMKEGGPGNAIDVCKLKAPAIAMEKSSAHGLKIGRTSLKTRNDKNKPDAWESKTLQFFEEQKAKGEELTKIEFGEIVTENGKRIFRYMKAIPTGEVCLKCHGEEIPEEVLKKLDELYPNDMARGFKKGDIRGAFTIMKPLEI